MSIFGQPKRIAQPMSGLSETAVRDGSLGLRGPYSSVRGLGALGLGATPWQCWNVQAFKDCHAVQWGNNQRACTTGGVAARDWDGNVDNCINALTDLDDGLNCVPKYCAEYNPPPRPVGKVLDAGTVVKLQNQLNADLRVHGFKTISADGKLGPATCGAAFYLWNSNPKQSTVWTDYDLISYCGTGAYTNPTLVGAAAPLRTAVMPTTTIVAGQPIAPLIIHQWNQADAQMAQIQTEVNAILDANGYLSIPITGKLDAATCGAMKWARDNTGNDMLVFSGQNCQGFTAPTKKPASIDPRNAPRGSGPPSIAPAPPSPGLSKASMMMGGLALLAAGGAYYYAKKKGMV